MAQIDQGRDYFHINRVLPYAPHPLLKVGDCVDIGGESNPFFRFYETQKKTYPLTGNDGQVVQVPGVAFLGGAKDGGINCPNIAGIAHDLSMHLAGLVGELILEDVRKKEFPHLPSRQRCIWLIPDIAGIRYWVSRLGATQGGFQVLRVRCQGRMHIASEKYLTGDSAALEEVVSKSRQYWLGVVPEPNTEEIIFEGRVAIQEILSPEQYM